MLLLAVPGSGKTTVLIARLGYLILCQGVDPAKILTMTYTVAATGEMRRRFGARFGEEYGKAMTISTINSLAMKIIGYYARNYGRRAAFTQVEDKEAVRILGQIYREVNRDFATEAAIRDLRTAITYVKNQMLTPEELEEADLGVDHLPEIYGKYNEALRAMGRMDYDDQLTYAYTILKGYPGVLDHFRRQFTHICVDESQDTSRIQHELIRLLAGPRGSLFMVGDEDQSIYGVRPAFTLTTEEILLLSNTSGGKRSGETGPEALTPALGEAIDSWKLTVKDPALEGFTLGSSFRNGDLLTVSYSGAVTGENHFISAIVTDEAGSVKYYGRLKDLTQGQAEGDVEIDLSHVSLSQGDELYLFNEVYNGDCATDYAGGFTAVDLTAEPKPQEGFRFAQEQVEKTYGDGSFVLEAEGAADGSTVTYSGSDNRLDGGKRAAPGGGEAGDGPGPVLPDQSVRRAEHHSRPGRAGACEKLPDDPGNAV